MKICFCSYVFVCILIKLSSKKMPLSDSSMGYGGTEGEVCTYLFNIPFTLIIILRMIFWSFVSTLEKTTALLFICITSHFIFHLETNRLLLLSWSLLGYKSFSRTYLVTKFPLIVRVYLYLNVLPIVLL